MNPELKPPYTPVPCNAGAEILDPPGPEDTLADWLKTQANTWANKKTAYVLSYHWDGVVWGRIEGDDLQVSTGRITSSPKLRKSTLIRTYLFNETFEVLLWHREAAPLKARVIAEAAHRHTHPDLETHWTEACDTNLLLYGEHWETTDDNFAILRQGELRTQLYHVPPTTPKAGQRLCLKIRRYVTATSPDHPPAYRLVGFDSIPVPSEADTS